MTKPYVMKGSRGVAVLYQLTRKVNGHTQTESV